MNKTQKTLTVLAISGAAVGVWAGGSALVGDVQFARAEQQVADSRQQLQSVQDLASVFRNIGQAVEPSVVEIEVVKTIKGARRNASGGPGGDDFLKKFFQQHGMPNPDGSETPNTPNSPGNPSSPNGSKNNDDDNGESAPGMPGQGDLQERGTGSGVIMQVDGSDAYILTNNHVAGDATELTVTLNDGRVIRNGKVLGTDPKSDLAVVKIKADKLIAAKWGDSDKLTRGDWVLAFGAPFGYVGSMTHGIVSALGRSNVGILGQNGYENFIQVDAPINPGNSGGPLVNINGDVIGINTAIATQSGGFQGIGFAIPSDQAKTIYTMLRDKGKVTRGWLGVSIGDVQRDPGLAKSFGFDKDTGVLVEQVLGGTPATGKTKSRRHHHCRRRQRSEERPATAQRSRAPSAGDRNKAFGLQGHRDQGHHHQARHAAQRDGVAGSQCRQCQ